MASISSPGTTTTGSSFNFAGTPATTTTTAATSSPFAATTATPATTAAGTTPAGTTTSTTAPATITTAAAPSVFNQPPKRLLIFQETRNPHNAAETVYVAVNTQGLPICGAAPEFATSARTAGSGSVLDLPLRVIKAFTEIFNNPRYKNWAIVSAGLYHDPSEEGRFYAVVLEQVRDQTQGAVKG